MESNRKRILGLFLVLIGLLFLFNNLGYLPPIPHYIWSWPMILVLVGLFNLLTGNTRSAVILILVGGFFLLNIHAGFELRTYWPVILVVIGLVYIFRNRVIAPSKSTESAFDDINIFGGSEKRFVSDPLKSGRITNIFGGSDIDLSESKPIDGATIEVFTMFGGCDITVPNDWQLEIDTVAVFGGFSDKRKTITTTGPRVVIKGVMIFGGGDLKSH